MIQRSNPRVIGGFVLGALALLAAAVLIFGSAELFKTYSHAVIYFRGSVGGLRVGAPVELGGVQIGTVRQISIEYDVANNQAWIPILIDIDPKRIKPVGRADGELRFPIAPMVERGLRAELRMQSFVTGQLAVQLTFNPRAEARRHGGDLAYPEIPTVPSPIEQAQEFLTELAGRAPQMIDRLNVVLDLAADVLGELSQAAPVARAALTDLARFSKALGDSEQNIRSTLASLTALTSDLDQLANHADAAAVGFGDTAKRLNRLVGDNEGAIKSMIAQYSKVGAGLAQLTENLNLIAQDNREGLKDFSSTGLYDLTNLIRDTQELVGNLNRTIDELKRNPSQFLFGQQPRDIPTSRAKAP